MDTAKFRAATRLRTVAGVIASLSISACASGGGSTASAAPVAASSGASSPAQASLGFGDGEVERTKFGASLGVDFTKMVRRPSGLYVQDFQTGTGAVAAQTRTAVLRYVGYLPDGKSFDSGEISIAIGAGKVIRAWDEGVLGMRVGGKRRLVSPPHLAYGAKGAPPAIPANAVLVFDMELLQVY